MMKKIGTSILLILTVLISIFSVSASAEEPAIVIFSRDSISLYPTQTYKLMLSDTSITPDFVTSDGSVATISDDGTVTAVSEGTAIVTSKFSSGYSSQCTVEVKSGTSPKDISLNVQNLTLSVGTGRVIKATVYPSDIDDKTVYYSSSDNSVATVSSDGYVNAVGVGVAVISAESSSSAVSKKCIVKVNSKSGAGNFSVSVSGTAYSLSGSRQSNVVMELKNSKYTERTTTDDNGQFIFEDIAQGVYVMSMYKDEDAETAIATTEISVNSYNISMTCIINKNELVLLYQDQLLDSDDITDIVLEKSSIILNRGEEYDMTFTVRPDNAVTPMLMSVSSDEDIATVNADGKITAISEGKATVIFSTIDGKISKTCIVTVTDTDSNTYSWVIILLEVMILLIISVIFICVYKKFLKQKEKEEMGEL